MSERIDLDVEGVLHLFPLLRDSIQERSLQETPENIFGMLMEGDVISPSLDAKIAYFLAARYDLGIEAVFNSLGKMASYFTPTLIEAKLTLEQKSTADFGVACVRTFTTHYGSNMEEVHQSILYKISQNNADLLLAPEYSYRPRWPNCILEQPQKDAYVNEILDATVGKSMVVVPGTFIWAKGRELYNTAYVISDGRIILEYHKMTYSTGDRIIAEKNGITVKTGTEVGTFELRGLNYGLEICSDSGILFVKGVRDLDIQILVSSGNVDIRMESVADEGHGIINDGMRGVLIYTKRHGTTKVTAFPMNPLGSKFFLEG